MASITVQQVMDRVKHQLGATWQDSEADRLQIGDAKSIVTGIATSYTPSIHVLKQAVAMKKNLIITQQPAFYEQDALHAESSDDSVAANFHLDPAYLFKKQFIETNQLAIWRLDENWNRRAVDGQLLGLAKALGWDKYHFRYPYDSGESYAAKNKFFLLPEDSLRNKVREISAALQIPGIRVIGDPATRVKKASLSNGMFQFTELLEILQQPAIDLIVIAEAIEWESCEYFRDLLTWKGKNKAMILLGREAAEDPGSSEVAVWLKSFVHEIPTHWISAKTPFWIPA
jgi:putative NIF3 family GTP cyclohydrolase 1 type 2